MVFLLHLLHSQAQFKTIYTPNPVDLYDINTATANRIITLNEAGDSLAFTGRLTGKDAGGNSIAPFYVFQMDNQGLPLKFSYFKNIPNLGQPSFGLGMDYHEGKFFIGGASNFLQTLTCTNLSGTQLWSRSIGHHEFNSVLYDSRKNAVIAFGWEETTFGGHDFLLVRLDTLGNFIDGKKYGTEFFDIPKKVIETEDGYLMAGASVDFDWFNILLVCVDTSLNLKWSKTYNGLKDHTIGGMTTTDAGKSYIISGYAKGSGMNPKDSLFVLKVDSAGTPIYYKTYMTSPSTSVRGLGMTKDPWSGNLLISGSFSASFGSYRQPFVANLDSLGNTLWANEYGDGDTITDEALNDIVIVKNEGKFVAVGDYLLENPPGNFSRHFFSLSAGSITGVNGCESPLNFSSYNRAIISRSDSTYTEPYTEVYNYSYTPASAEMQWSQTCTVTTRLDKWIENQRVIVYPNPSYDHVTIELRDSDPPFLKVELISITGEFVYQKAHFSGRTMTLNTSDFSAGLYYLRISTENTQQTKRLIILR